MDVAASDGYVSCMFFLQVVFDVELLVVTAGAGLLQEILVAFLLLVPCKL